MSIGSLGALEEHIRLCQFCGCMTKRVIDRKTGIYRCGKCKTFIKKIEGNDTK